MDCTPRARSAPIVLVAVDPVRELDDEHEPAAHVAAVVLARQRELALPASASRYQPGHARAVGEHVVEPVELRQPERAGDVA